MLHSEYENEGTFPLERTFKQDHQAKEVIPQKRGYELHQTLFCHSVLEVLADSYLVIFTLTSMHFTYPASCNHNAYPRPEDIELSIMFSLAPEGHQTQQNAK
jgi:hypothetical protein